MPKLTQMDPALQEAALIWGVLPSRLSRKVTIHEIMPGIVSGAIMAFTMSLDDFVISYFVYGPSYVTLPVEIYNYTKNPCSLKIYALFHPAVRHDSPFDDSHERTSGPGRTPETLQHAGRAA